MDRAIYELESALATGPKAKDAAQVHALLAQSLAATGRKADAARARDKAIELDPENAEAFGEWETWLEKQTEAASLQNDYYTWGLHEMQIPVPDGA